MSGKKYFFDTHNFDAPEGPDPDLPPPPPMFTLEELGQARDAAFAQGREVGTAETTRSREMYLAAQMERIAHEVFGLQLAEQMREKTYEREAISLCTAIFQKLFPHLNALHGLDEIKAVIASVIQHQPDVSKIIIDVPSTDCDDIENLMKNIPDLDLTRIEIRGIDGLEVGSCRLQWKDGAALRDPSSLADEILKALQETLAGKTQTPQNDDNNKDHNDDEVMSTAPSAEPEESDNA